ncbi:MAG: hypothetical protein KR126chlam1_00458 [Chlamydiae bacterium]|nr:hypothetical protein [Chlamydiota bacterium]
MDNRVFIFGESEKGELCTPTLFLTLAELAEKMGNPNPESKGINSAVQMLLSQYPIIFYRVREEGYSKEDYLRGVKLLYKESSSMNLSAICLPGVGDAEIINPLTPICKKNSLLMILSEEDLYDYLTGLKY